MPSTTSSTSCPQTRTRQRSGTQGRPCSTTSSPATTTTAPASTTARSTVSAVPGAGAATSSVDEITEAVFGGSGRTPRSPRWWRSSFAAKGDFAVLERGTDRPGRERRGRVQVDGALEPARARTTRMEDAVVKTVAGFLNTDGGTLLIGVRHDGTSSGWERLPRSSSRRTPTGSSTGSPRTSRTRWERRR